MHSLLTLGGVNQGKEFERLLSLDRLIRSRHYPADCWRHRSVGLPPQADISYREDRSQAI